MKDFKPVGIPFNKFISQKLSESKNFNNRYLIGGAPSIVVAGDINELLDNFFLSEFIPFLNSNGYAVMFTTNQRTRHREKKGVYLRITSLSAQVQHGSLGTAYASEEGPTYVINTGFFDRNCHFRMEYEMYDSNKNEFVPCENHGNEFDLRELEIFCMADDNTIHVTELNNRIKDIDAQLKDHEKAIEYLKSKKESFTWLKSYMEEHKIQTENLSKLKSLMIISIMKNAATDSTIDPTTQISELLEIDLKKEVVEEEQDGYAPLQKVKF